MTTTIDHDCIWFWASNGWRLAQPKERTYAALRAMHTEIESMGIPCHYGSINIGPPSTPPEGSEPEAERK